MIYLTQLVYVKEGQQEVFHQFEEVAIPLIAKYNGQLLLRIRPTDDSYIEQQMERPYEIHFVKFDTEDDFVAFSNDESRKQFLHLKEQSVRTAILIKGEKL
jgi:antibiotic biosynthesis monooxygenase (ABM) superfamily enzyme